MRIESLCNDIASFGRTRGVNYAVKITNLISNDFYIQDPRQQLSDEKGVVEFKNFAQSTRIDTNGRDTVPAVKKWIKYNHPSEFYACWKQDSSYYKDDSVEIYYRM